MALIAGDELDPADGRGEPASYERAFALIDRDPAQLLVVVTDGGRSVVATLQLTLIPGLARRGALRAQIEAVRVRPDVRGRGLGRGLVAWSIEEARSRGCALVQLTSDKRRPAAHRLYADLGFRASHEGFKLRLDLR